MEDPESEILHCIVWPAETPQAGLACRSAASAKAGQSTIRLAALIPMR